MVNKGTTTKIVKRSEKLISMLLDGCCLSTWTSYWLLECDMGTRTNCRKYVKFEAGAGRKREKSSMIRNQLNRLLTLVFLLRLVLHH